LIGAGRDQEVRLAGLHAVAGVVEDAHGVLAELIRVFLDACLELGAVAQVGMAQRAEARLAQRRAHVGGVVGRVHQHRRVLVGGVADDERDLRTRGAAARRDAAGGEQHPHAASNAASDGELPALETA
jgi:hypothetical protein